MGPIAWASSVSRPRNLTSCKYHCNDIGLSLKSLDGVVVITIFMVAVIHPLNEWSWCLLYHHTTHAKTAHILCHISVSNFLLQFPLFPSRLPSSHGDTNISTLPHKFITLPILLKIYYTAYFIKTPTH